MSTQSHLALRSPTLMLTAALALLLVGPMGITAPAGAADYPSSYSNGDGYGETVGYDGSYSYVRTLEGAATLIQGDTGDRDALQENQPVLVGDRVLVSPRGRAEVVLSDRNLLRLDGGTEVLFEALAGSPDRQDRATVLRLSQGNVQLVLVRDFLGEGLPRVDTPNVTVYPRDLGNYRITAAGGDWSEVVAREGSAEVVTREGSLRIAAGEEVVVEGEHRPRESVRRAGREDSLELWGRRLDQEARYAATPYLDDSLRYEAATLNRYGSWSTIDGRYAWRPRVGVEWRPYYHGRWDFSPLGLVWVSSEPWGWAPYHYGSWDYVPSHGWVWFPGRRFAPAWVYWYWTDHYAGWVPVGYYTRHYYPHFGNHFGFRFGVYGWAGGHWGHYDRWVFCSNRYIGVRDQHRFARPGDRFGREHRYAVPKRGILTTDTRGLSRIAVRRSQGIEQTLASRSGGDLPDVTPFVERRRNLPDDVRNRILVDRGGADAGRAAGRSRTPLLAVDDIPGAGTARGGSGAARAVPRTPDRVVIDRGDDDRGTQAPVLSRKPAQRPTTVRPEEGLRDGRPAAGTPSAGTVDSTRPRTPLRTRPSTEAPARIERRPAAPSRDWRTRDPVTPPRASAPERAEPPRGRAASPRTARPSSEPASPPPGRDAAASWRERPRTLPDRPVIRGGERREYDTRDRSSVPRRVIEGVRSNRPGSTPFRTRTDARPSRVEPRSAPPARVEPRSSRPPSASRSSRPSSSPRTRSAAPSRSRPSSPPPGARSSSSRSRPSASASRGSSSRSSSRSSSGRAARRKPPGV